MFEITSKALEKANLLLLTRHATEKDRSLKKQLLVFNSKSGEDVPIRERIWSEQGFFGDERSDFGMPKVDYPEKTLIYVNQAYLTVKKGESFIYAGQFILGQVIPTANLSRGH